MRTLLSFLIIAIATITVCAQTITQTVKGTIIDQATQESMIGATILLLDSDPLLGTTTNLDGYFELKNVPVGRHDFEIRMLGYETYQAREILVTSGKEVVLEIQMLEDMLSMDEIVVEYSPIRHKAINRMATLSTQKFTIEETQRFAGGISDPARMVSAYAGVASPSISSNGISVRGNSPGGLLWRIEGVEVPSPNHFADLSIVGAGALTVLSSQVLGESDFSTGAFPAEYGNATSGLFDINLRKGNTSRPEYTIQAGVLGLDVGMEGPLKSSNQSSYLVNYRYSTLGAIGAFLPNDAGILKYQDLSFKLSNPTEKAGTFTFWGIGAYDAIDMEALDLEERVSQSDSENSQTAMYLFATGLNHKTLVGTKSVLNSSLAASGNGLSFDEQSEVGNNTFPLSKARKNTYKVTLQSSLNTYLTNSHNNQSGFYLNLLGYGLDLNNTEEPGESPQNIVDENGLAFQAQFFSQSKFTLSEKLSLNAGFHSQYVQINDAITFEPRLGFDYQLNQNNSIAFAYGRHSQAESLPIYFVKDANGDTPNTSLDLMKSNHFVFSFTSMLSDHLRLNIEPYLQLIEDVPVVPGSYVSTINSREILFFNETLVSEGSARNFGIDVTLERYLHNGLYYLVSGSVFDSKYTAQDGIERNTRFNKNFVGNALIGKEWQVGRDGNNTFSANLRLNVLGGNRKEAIDDEKSTEAQDIVYGETNGERSFSDQHPSTPIVSFTLSYRKNKPGRSSVWSLQVLNAGQAEDFETDIFNLNTQKAEPKYTAIMIPNLSWRLEF